jgi:hypothetical protein
MQLLSRVSFLGFSEAMCPRSLSIEERVAFPEIPTDCQMFAERAY